MEKQGYLFENPTKDQRVRTRDASMTGEAVKRSANAPRPDLSSYIIWVSPLEATGLIISSFTNEKLFMDQHVM